MYAPSGWIRRCLYTERLRMKAITSGAPLRLLLGVVVALITFIAAVPSQAKAPPLKTRIAVLPFVNKAEWGGEALGSVVVSLINEALSTNKNFILMESEEIKKELADEKWADAVSDAGKAVDFGKSVSANVVIIGVIDKLAVEVGDVSARVKNALEISAVDTSTGDVFYTKKEEVEFNTNSPAVMAISSDQYDDSAAREILKVAAFNSVTGLSVQLSSRVWQGYIQETDKDYQIWINAGSESGVVIGYRFEVIKSGKRKGVIEVVETKPEKSRARLVEGMVIEVGDLIRPLAEQTAFEKPEKKKEEKAEDSGIYSQGSLIYMGWKGEKGVIDMGADDGVQKGDRLMVARETAPQLDEKSGKVMPSAEAVVGMVEVTSVVDASTSEVKVVKGGGEVRKGDYVRRRVSPPTDLAGEATGFRRIRLKWAVQPEPETEGYIIYRGESPSGPFKEISKNRKRESVTYVDEHSMANPMEDSKSYYYRITAVNSLNVESEPSQVVGVFTMGPPPPPEGLAAENWRIRSVPLSWNEHENKEVSGYKLYRSKSPDGPFEMIKEIKRRNETKYHDFGGGTSSSPMLDDATTYYYAISALSSYNDEGEKSEPITVTTADPPTPPTGFEAQSWRPRKVPLSWDVHIDDSVRGYLIYRSNEERGPYAQIAEIKERNKNSYVDGERSGLFSTGETLKNFTLYYYKIQAYNWAGSRSKMSEPVSATTKPAPLAPEDVKTTSNRPLSVPVTWRLSPEADLEEYRIYRSDSEIGEFKKIGDIPADKNYFLDKGLESDKTYYYKIQAVDKFGMEGEFSKVVSAKTKKKPDPVHGLHWANEGDGVTLKWDKNPEIDITEYIIYKKGFFGWKKIGSTKETFYIVEDMGRGDRDDFTVSAKDADGLEGEKSGVLTVDLR